MLILKNAKAIFPDRVREKNVIVKDGKIVDICGRFDGRTENAEIIDCGGLYLSPGFIDVHVHGGGGYSAMSGNPDDIIKMCEAHAWYGTTSILPTTLAAPIGKIQKAMSAIDDAMGKCGKCNILGIHLEGPFLSQEMKGAQSPENILAPSGHDPAELLDYSENIKMMGAAPETEGGFDLGLEISKRGIVASVAHSNAVYDDIEKALEYGYSDVTHLYSACSSVTKVNLFRIGGVVEAALALDGYTTQFIADLRHLPAGILKLIYKCKGADKAYAITDGLEFSAMEIDEGGIYTQENGLATVYEDGVMKLADRSCLAGSVATCAKLVRNLYKSADIPLADAVRMATLTPASVSGVQKYKGKISNGYDADLVLFDSDVNVKLVTVKGTVIRNDTKKSGVK
ncbi:MAG: N-acetylglucosamine-6-phosphate deacetylase [Oscillospiraceae bacterium]|nr:N-acetylglucosamine-6-phosphate deacetylase [Oscillospiraceae bacterium]